MTCFSTFLGVLTAFKTKSPFTSVIYAISIKKKILPKKAFFKLFLIFSFVGGRIKKIHSLFPQYFFSLKLHKLPIFMLLRQYIYRINEQFFNVFRRFTTFKGKPSLLRKKYDFTPKVTYLIIFYWFQCFDKKKKINTIYIFFLWNCTKYPFLTFLDLNV